MADRPTSSNFRDPFSLGEDFAIPSLDAWRDLAEKSLKGSSLDRLARTVADGIVTRPLYSGDDEGLSAGRLKRIPYANRSSERPEGEWEICPIFNAPVPETVSTQMAAESQRGADALWLRFAPAVRSGREAADHVGSSEDPDRGTHAFDVEQLSLLFAGVPVTKRSVHLDAGANSFAAAATFVAAADRHGVDLIHLKGSFSIDPLGSLAADGEAIYGLHRSFDLAAAAAAWCLENTPGVRAIAISALPYDLAGADSVQGLALALATGIEYLRVLERAGIAPEQAASQLKFILPIGRNLFLEAAKIRAFRALWKAAIRACGVDDDHSAAFVHAVSSARSLTAKDPWVNLLRGTIATFSATIGGVDAMTVLPFDSRLGPSDEQARRLALNTQVILREESHLNHVGDPAGGSWFIEQLTAELVDATWNTFREIESRGGMTRFLTEGGVEELLESKNAERRGRIRRRQMPITGVSTWPNLEEGILDRPGAAVDGSPRISGERTDDLSSCAGTTPLLQRLSEVSISPDLFDTAVEAAGTGASTAQLAASLASPAGGTFRPPLAPQFDAAEFEALRRISDVLKNTAGKRPCVFLATIGSIAEYTARATFAKNFFAAGGVEAVEQGALESVEEAVSAFSASGAVFACICSSDRVYTETAETLAAGLKRAGARRLFLAGRPAENESSWRAAGIDSFVHFGCDVLSQLRSFFPDERGAS